MLWLQVFSDIQREFSLGESDINNLALFVEHKVQRHLDQSSLNVLENIFLKKCIILHGNMTVDKLYQAVVPSMFDIMFWFNNSSIFIWYSYVYIESTSYTQAV